jgi:hypothetical protein
LELALYPTALISVFKGVFLPDHFSFEAMSAVSDSTDSESVLYLTVLIHEFLPSNMNISGNSKPNSKIF